MRTLLRLTVLATSLAFAAQRIHAHPGTLDVKSYGALGNGTTDDTVAIQNAINAALPGQVVAFPPGTYLISSQLSVTKGLVLQGASATSSVIKAAASMSGSNMIAVATNAAVSVFDLTFTSDTAKSGGAGISLSSASPTTSYNFASRFARLRFINQHRSFSSVSAQIWVMEQCEFDNSVAYGVYIQDNVASTGGDGGDNVLSGNTFVIVNDTNSNAIGVHHRSGGGLRMTNNKILGHSIGYQLCLDTSANTSISLIATNSIEGQRDRGIQIRRCGGTATTNSYSSISISGNQIAAGNSSTTATARSVDIEVLDGGTVSSPSWVRSVAIVGNIFSLSGVNTAAAISISAGTQMHIADNVFSTMPLGIGVYAPATYVRLGPNSYSSGVATKYFIDPASTGSGTCTGCANYN